MCDVKKYNDIFQEIKSLRQDDTLQLILEAKTQEERFLCNGWKFSITE